MNILIISCTTGLNIGNNFINKGCEYIVKELFPGANIQLYEALETVSENKKTFLPVYKKYLNSFDLIFIACGSLISRHGIMAIRNILSLKPKKIFMGLGMTYYNDEEIKYCQEIEKRKNAYFFVRDNETYRAFKNHNINVFRGIDCAFYLTNIQKKIKNKKRYAVINLDTILDNQERILQAIKNLKNNGYKYVYVIENTTTKYANLPKKIKNNYVLLSHWYSLYTFYQNASLVLTNRVHTTVACLSNNVPVCFEWTYKNIDMTKRLKLFKRIGIFVIHGKTITHNYVQQIENYKNEFFTLLQTKINAIIEEEL
jgi:polysaccharide pyruvyl transferase WcaK-like protein